MATLQESHLRNIGFNDPNVISGILRDPGQVARYERELGLTTSSQTSGGGGAPSSVQSAVQTAKELLGFQQEANKPAIASLQAGIPETRERFASERTRLEGEKSPLSAKYAQLLADVTKDTNLSQTREFGKRGIPTSSGLLQQTLAEKNAASTERLGLAEGADLRDISNLITQLSGEETSSVRNIQNAITQLQAGGGADAISQALSLLGSQEQTRQFEVGTELQKQQLAQPQTSTVTAGGRVKLINTATGEVIQDLGASTSGGGTDLSFLSGLFGGDTLFNEPKPTSPPGGLSDLGLKKGFTSNSIFRT